MCGGQTDRCCGAGKGACRGVGRNMCRGADGACGAPPQALLAPGPPSFFHGFASFALRSMHTPVYADTRTRARLYLHLLQDRRHRPPRHPVVEVLLWTGFWPGAVRGTGSARRERMRESQRAHAKDSEPEQVRAPKRGLSREREHDIESVNESKSESSCERE